MKGKPPGISFLIIGVAFLAIGASGQRTFITLGIVFIAIGAGFMARQKRARSK